MKIKDIAKKGLKGRKRDTLLIKLVITLSFVFIITSIIFQSSTEKTKSEQALDLYGQWHAAYLEGNEEILKKLKSEKDIDKVGVSRVIGESDKCGVVGTFNKELIDMGRFSLYKGNYPTKDNEIMLELNQMSKMNLDLDVGQKIQVAITIPRTTGDLKQYLKDLSKEFRNKGVISAYEINKIWNELRKLEELKPESEKEKKEIEEKKIELGKKLEKYQGDRGYWSYQQIRYNNHHETPFEQIGDVVLISSNNYTYFYIDGEKVNPEVIRQDGFIEEQKIILKKEFIVTGILQTYSDKWDVGDYKVPNAFITEEGGKTFTDAFYGTKIGDFSDHEMGYNIFLSSDLLKENLYKNLHTKYPDRTKEIEQDTISKTYDPWYFAHYLGGTEQDIDKAFKELDAWKEPRNKEGEDNSLEVIDELGKEMEINLSNFRKNTLAYPDTKGSTEYVLTLTIIAIIFIATALAIFQIFLTQMKRRSRKLVLLKSIGATKAQILNIIFHEGLYFLRTGILIGVPGGLILSVIIVHGMNIFGKRDLQYHIEPSLLLLGILAGILSLFIGMVVPMIFAIKIPLVGTMSKPPKHTKKKLKENRKLHYQSFNRINWEYFKLNKGKTFISFGISLITITIIVSTIFLSYSSFNNYKDTVMANSRPDYVMEAIYGESSRQIEALEEEIGEIQGVESVEVYKVGKQLFLWHNNLKEDKILNDFEKLLPKELKRNYFNKYNTSYEEFDKYISDAYITKVYGISKDSKNFEKYSKAITEGKIDLDKFNTGEEIILLAPMYLPGENINKDVVFGKREVLSSTNEDNRMDWLFNKSKYYKLSHDERYSNYYKKQNSIKSGDTIYLSTTREGIMGGGDSYGTDSLNKKVKVGGIIHYFPKGGAWPFSNTKPNYIVISSITGMEKLYPASIYGLGKTEINEMQLMIDTLHPYKFGRTIWHINTDSKTSDVVQDASLLSVAHNNNYTIYNYKESSSRLYHEAFNNVLIIGLLGITAAIIACIILYNILISKMEQDKNRIGILQAMGVTKEEFSKHYIKVGAITGGLALIIANIGLALVFLLTSITSMDISMSLGGTIKDIFLYKLWLYPWSIHLLLCILFFVLTVLMYYLPSKNIIKQSPVENIRSLSR